ncbi:MAG: hypothetical protein LQ345_004156 [Seirophora villosa]|nr:MAG: hypothetical protein LQ345_004156 [Seirophora villosa]
MFGTPRRTSLQKILSCGSYALSFYEEFHRSLSFSVNGVISTEVAHVFYLTLPTFTCGTSQPLSRVIARKRIPGTLVVDDIRE